MKALLIGSVSLLAAVAFAYDIHHPNLRDAHAETEQAVHHIEAAQKANKGEFGGHAGKAIEHLRQAQAEIIEADKWNDAHGNK